MDSLNSLGALFHVIAVHGILVHFVFTIIIPDKPDYPPFRDSLQSGQSLRHTEMYQFNKTPRVWQHPTPQQTFPEVQSSKTAKQSGYLTDRLRSEPPDKDDSASTSQSETLDAGAAFFNRLAKSTHNPNAQLKMPTRQYTTPQASSSSSSPTDMPLLNKLRRMFLLCVALSVQLTWLR